MENNNAVIFKGRKNGITILLDNKAEFTFIKDTLRRKMADAGHFFSGARTNVSFKGRELNEDEESELLDIIRASNMDIRFVGDAEQAEAVATVAAAEEPGGDRSVFHRGSLRSGQAIRFDGSVVVLGDVNPGGEIIATGNVVVLGALKGLVHAGCKGDSTCFVSALNMSPTQLRIADIITYIPEEVVNAKKHRKKKSTGTESSYAYVKAGQIYIAPL